MGLLDEDEELRYLIQQIEELREEINKMVDKAGLEKRSIMQPDILNKSKELDVLIVQYYKKII